jgi:hypothetical protein
MPEAFGYRRNAAGLYQWSPGAGQANRGDFAWVRGPSWRGPPGAYRVLVLGGSVAVGTGAEGADRWFEVLERELARRLGRSVAVMPLACGAWVSAQERVAFELWGLEAAPEAVVLMTGWNDCYVACEGTRPGDPMFMALDYAAFYGGVSDGQGVARLSVVRRGLASTLAQRHAAAMAADPAYATAVARAFRHNVEAVVRRCQREGIAVLPVLQPTRVRVDPARVDPTDDVIRAGYAAIFRDLPQGVHDASAVVPAREFVFGADSVHFGPAGHRALGLWVADRLTDLSD